ncbi:haloacid dehalogenase-like hydrolase [Patescibacteria group bacterium]|nr:haloacid dehalogenase-like hydrolase [Patescibacteria group bacterium]
MEKKKLAIYDLDGTITKYDSLYFFIIYLMKKNKISIGKIIIPLINHIIFKKHPKIIKSIILSAIKAKNETEMDKLCYDFAYNHLKCKQECIRQINQEKNNGYFLILLTAAFDSYANIIGKKLGFDLIISIGQVNFENDHFIYMDKRKKFNKGEGKLNLLVEEINLDDFDLSKSKGYGNKDDLPWLTILGYKKIY